MTDIGVQFLAGVSGNCQTFVFGGSSVIATTRVNATVYKATLSYPATASDGAIIVQEEGETAIVNSAVTKGATASSGTVFTIGRLMSFGLTFNAWDGEIWNVRIWEDGLLVHDIPVNDGSNNIYDRLSDETYTLVPDTGSWS